MLNPLWLKTFQTLIDTGHFTRTAEKLYMTQPGVSQHIKKLEQACGYPLIERYNKSFEITQQGIAVYQYALQYAHNETALLASLHNDDPFSGPVSLSCSGSLALLLYPKLLDLQCKYPNLIIQLEAAPNKKILADILSGEMDLGIVRHLPKDGRYATKPLGEEALCLMLPKSKAASNLTQDHLQSIGLIRHPDVEHYLSLYFSTCNEDALRDLNTDDFPHTGYVNQLNQILLPVSKGLGFTVLPYNALKNFVNRDQISVYQAQQNVVEKLHLISKKRRPHPARFQTVINEIEQILNLKD